MKIKQRGFTLVEVLIVVVIIAILAALILPRLTSQSENAYIAEAQNMLGSMRRAQENHCALTECTRSNDYNTNWMTLGLNTSNAAPTATNWTYALAASGTNTATRVSTNATYNGKVISLTPAGHFACGAPYSALLATNPNTKGCRA